MHTSLKVLNAPSNSWEKNDPGGTSRSHNSTPKAGQCIQNVAKTNWTELEITGTICNLSPNLWGFVHLTKLNLRNNNLNYLPPDIMRLHNLTVLDVTANKLQSIPSEVGEMISLKELLLNNNCLKNLPYELGKLFQLQKLGLKGNPLPTKYFNISNEMNGTQKLLGYLFDNLNTPVTPLPDRPWVPLANPDSTKPIALFTVMCYNVLCDKYCTRQLYGYCPPWALGWEYRKKTIMHEIKRYQSDIISLQEVETEQFYEFFQPELKQDGYDGIFSPKSRARTMLESERKHVDGCAIFYKTSKFRALKDHLVEFNQLAIEAADGSHDMINRVMTKDNIGLAALLETTEAIWQNGLPPEGRVNRPLLVATCHVHWDPEFCDVKLIQTMMLMHRLQTIIKEAQMSLRTENTEGSVDCNSIPLILCGDLNSLPDSGVVEYLRSGHVPTNHKDFKEIVYDDCLTKLSQTDSKEIYSHGFRLSQAYSKDIMPYTNYTYEFKGIIDYVFYSRDTMNCLGVLGSLDSNWFADNRVIGCPHPQIPSDHLPLLAQFEMNASPSNRHVNNYTGSTRR